VLSPSIVLMGCRPYCSMQGLCVAHLHLLAALPRLTVVNLYFLDWANDAIGAGPTLLAASLPRLRVLNAPSEVLVRSRCTPGSACVSDQRVLNLWDDSCSSVCAVPRFKVLHKQA
jgi:hypothetical protein